jgi:shikimate kinase
MIDKFRGRPSITLTGFMFSGKSRVGSVLADRLGLEFVDLDSEIERETVSSVEEIFTRDGESEFRRLEREAVARVLPRPGQVVAVGGGAVIDPDNLKIISEHSCVVWLKVTVQTVLDRWKNSYGRARPLLQVEDPEREIVRMMDERRQFYSRCDISVDSEEFSVDKVVEDILQSLDTGRSC